MTHEERYHYNGRCYAGLPETNSVPVSECTNGNPVVFAVGVIDGFEIDYDGYYNNNRYMLVVRFEGKGGVSLFPFKFTNSFAKEPRTTPNSSPVLSK